MRLVFAGTPQTAVPSLMALLASKHTVAAVVTRPDAPAGRGRRVAASPVAQRASEAGIEILRPARPSDPDFLARLAQIGPDCCPVTAYGALIPGSALAIPPHGWVNLHFSVLPAWRGAAPVQHAILHGDEITGATTFSLVRELDAGPVYGVVTERVGETDTAGDLLERLSVSGAELLVATLDGIESGQLAARPQPPDGISLAPKLSRDDARVNWKLPALAIDRLVRACTPAPGAWTTFGGANLKIWPVTAAASCGFAGSERTGADLGGAGLGPGDIRVAGGNVLAGTGTAPVTLGDVQQEGKRRMPAADWARGIANAGRPLVLS
jgi:methionyl-tRNA formyltransferase